MATILLIEDEKNIASFIERGLIEFGHTIKIAYNGQEGWELINSQLFDLLIIDVMLPKINGLDLCKKYRVSFGYNTPILMLTALGTTEDIVKGLDAGADDYLIKPFSFLELEARIKAMLRRCIIAENNQNILHCADLTLYCTHRKVIRDNIEVDLTEKEFRLLEYFILNQGVVLSRLTLLKHVWDRDFDTNTNVVDVYVNYLRSKIDKDFDHKLIHTVVGIGYLMQDK